MLPAKEDKNPLEALIASCLQVIEAESSLSAAASFPANRLKETGSLVQLETCSRKVARLPEGKTKTMSQASFVLTSTELFSKGQPRL